MQRVGFIGLGMMGRPMAENLLAAGYELHCFARRANVAEELSAEGAKRHDTPADVVRYSDVVITIVSTDDDLRHVVLGAGGLIEGAAPANC